MSRAFIKDERHGSGIPRILLYSSCVAGQVKDYLLSFPEFASKFSVDVLYIHVLELDGCSDLAGSEYERCFRDANFIATNCFTPKWNNIGFERLMQVSGKARTSVFTWPPPNFTALWPVCEHLGTHGVDKMLKSGATRKDIIQAFKNGTFDPCFEARWDEQIGRLVNIDLGCDIKISGFMQRNHKKQKMFFTANHPTFNLVAWIGSQLMTRIGCNGASEDECVTIPHDTLGTWNTWPETKYEFAHYGFEYPMRYEHTEHWGGQEWYHSQIAKICLRAGH